MAANLVTGTAGGVDTSAEFATGLNDLEGKNLSICSLSMVRRGSAWCGVAQDGAAWLSW
jgi:hypothetical protein